MDDLKLIVEDKELNVKPPHGICSLPFLPFSLSQAYSENQPLTKKSTSKSIINSCTNTLSSGSLRLISDVLQVYHFFYKVMWDMEEHMIQRQSFENT